MKNITVEELEAIKNKTLERVNQGSDRTSTRILVGMGTCGIAAGANSVYKVLESEIKRLELENILLIKTGCIGICKLEPLVEIIKPGEERVTYVKMTPHRIRKVIQEHIMGGKVVDEYTIHVVQNKILSDFAVIEG